MPYCPRCGVEADASVRSCPLCQTSIPQFADLGPGEPAWPLGRSADDPAQTFASASEIRSRAFLVVAAVFATAALAVAAVDLSLTTGITWSRWPLLSLGAAFLLTASVFSWPRSPQFWGTAWFFVLVAFLLALDAADDGLTHWSGALGIPIVMATFTLVAVGGWAVKQTRRRGYNLFSLVLAFTAAELVIIDLLVTAWLGTPGLLSWSLVTTLVLGPGAFFFLLLHWTLARTPDLRRIFHF